MDNVLRLVDLLSAGMTVVGASNFLHKLIAGLQF